jgi:transcriptional regulator with GAF, ATPase, and Fis domain
MEHILKEEMVDMSTVESSPQSASAEALQLAEVVEAALAAQNLDEFVERGLPGIIKVTRSSSVLLYVKDSRLPEPCFFQQGLQTEVAFEVEKLCDEQFDQISSKPAQPFTAGLILYPLQAQEGCAGLMALSENADTSILDRLLPLLASAISRIVERGDADRRLAHLNTYLTVSSMLAQSMDLHELLEIALYCCMEAVSAEASSVLLLDDEKANFTFYQIEGPAKPVLAASTFPSDQGLAGSVLQSQQSEIVNDVSTDPRFYEKFDSESGFQTRNMIAVPLVAGEEQIGVLEVLNKSDGGPFTEEEHLLLISIAEEIAFAIRNAKVFEYVVNTYCKQRQGQMSCKGCERPLGSWTPCVKYREANAIV